MFDEDNDMCRDCYEDTPDCVCKPCHDCKCTYPVLVSFGDGIERCNDCHNSARQPRSEDEKYDDWVLGIED